MPAKSPPAKSSAASPAGEIDAFLATTEHPHKAEIVALRDIILGADAGISEGIKWNAPSYRTAADWFATTSLRARKGVQIVMHFGAKKRANFAPRAQIDDPEGLVEWLADDRGVVTFHDMDAVQTKKSAFAALIREWIPHVEK